MNVSETSVLSKNNTSGSFLENMKIDLVPEFDSKHPKTIREAHTPLKKIQKLFKVQHLKVSNLFKFLQLHNRLIIIISKLDYIETYYYISPQIQKIKNLGIERRHTVN